MYPMWPCRCVASSLVLPCSREKEERVLCRGVPYVGNRWTTVFEEPLLKSQMCVCVPSNRQKKELTLHCCWVECCSVGTCSLQHTLFLVSLPSSYTVIRKMSGSICVHQYKHSLLFRSPSLFPVHCTATYVCAL